MSSLSEEFLQGLVRRLCALPCECECVEFKENNADPQEIGEYISALSNSAAIDGRSNGYLLWGVRDADHALVGTRFNPATRKKGNEDLFPWLVRMLQPRLDIHFHIVTVEGQHLVLLEIPRATVQPIRFAGQEYIRIGSSKRKLKDHPDKEAALWRVFEQSPFEEGVAAEHLRAADVIRLLDTTSYFDLLSIPQPGHSEGILDTLASDRLVRRNDAGTWDITNLGALLFAKRLSDFPGLDRKAMRVILYRGTGRLETQREQLGVKGYASGFAGLVGYVNGLLPSNEVMGQALRQSVPMYPELAVRELVANALIHQDLSVSGAGPMVEIFDDRLEITNPGEPLIDTQRFCDASPRSRNETLAALMRRVGVCEERGSGIDKVIFQIELFQLPAPLFETPDGSTRAVLFAHKPLNEMDKPERVRACYLHACLRYVMREQMTNTSLRKRFGIEDKNSAVASRLLMEAVEAGDIVIADPEVGTRSRSYLPFWTTPRPSEG